MFFRSVKFAKGSKPAAIAAVSGGLIGTAYLSKRDQKSEDVEPLSTASIQETSHKTPQNFSTLFYSNLAKFPSIPVVEAAERRSRAPTVAMDDDDDEDDFLPPQQAKRPASRPGASRQRQLSPESDESVKSDVQSAASVLLDADPEKAAFAMESAEEEETTMWKRLFPWWPELNLPQAPKFDDFNREYKNCCQPTDIFEGFRVEYVRIATQMFLISQMFQIGQQEQSWALIPQYLFGDPSDPHALIAKVDTDSTVFGRLRWNILSKTLSATMSSQIGDPSLGQGAAISFESDIDIGDATGTIKLNYPASFHIEYMQAISQHFFMGAEVISVPYQSFHTATVVGRAQTDDWIGTAMLSTSGQFTATYTQHVLPYIDYAAELTYAQTPNGLESIGTIGYNYRLRAGSFTGRLDTHYRVVGVVEEMVNPFTKFTMSCELDHEKKAYKFGIGFQLQQ